MNRRQILIRTVATLLLATLGTGLTYAQGHGPQRSLSAADAVGTAFTYQGRLTHADEPVSGMCDLTFSLYDEAGTGTPPIGGTLLGKDGKPDAEITDGYFTVRLDFGSGVFTGDARWLQITVDCGEGAVTLSPRQPLTPSPYALALPGLWTHQNDGSSNLIGGYAGNSVPADTVGATIGGGGISGSENRVAGDYGTVGGGSGNTAAGDGSTISGGCANETDHPYAAIGGGRGNTVTGSHATVGGGLRNTANGTRATVAGGEANRANGSWATVPGGVANWALGHYAFAAGRGAMAYHDGAFVWADSTDCTFRSTAPDQFTVMATGGVNFETGSASFQINGNAVVPAHVVTVGSVGTPTENGTALLASLAGIADASVTEPYLLKIGPGVYDLSTKELMMKEHVDIEGSGELVTKITALGHSSGGTATVEGADNAELRFLTVENTGGDTYATAIFNAWASPRLTHVRAIASGGTYNRGVENDFGASPTMTNVTAKASGGSSSAGVFNSNHASPTMKHVTAIASGGRTRNSGVTNSMWCSPNMIDVTAKASGGSQSYGVRNDSSYTRPFTMTRVTAEASGAKNYNYGIYNSSASPTMMDVIATASGGDHNNYGLYNSSSSPTMVGATVTASEASHSNYAVYDDSSSLTMIDASLTASGGSGQNYGVYNKSSSLTMINVTAWALDASFGIYHVSSSGSYTVRVDNSRIRGNISTIRNDDAFTTFVGASLLHGGMVGGGGGTVTCAGVYDEDYAFYADTCP